MGARNSYGRQRESGLQRDRLRASPHVPHIYGLLSVAKIREKEYNGSWDLIKTNMGVYMVTAQRIIETINQAFFDWQTRK